MNISEAIEKIKVLLADNSEAQTKEIAPEPATQLVFETYDLKDGSKIDLSGLEIGADAMLVDDSGNSVSAPDGEYELADGTMMTVVGGKVEGIETPQAEAPTSEEAPMEMEVDSQFDEMNATITYLQAENEALKSKLGELESKFNQGFPKNYNLFAMGNHIKQVNNKNIIFGLKWWEHVTKFTIVNAAYIDITVMPNVAAKTKNTSSG